MVYKQYGVFKAQSTAYDYCGLLEGVVKTGKDYIRDINNTAAPQMTRINLTQNELSFRVPNFWYYSEGININLFQILGMICPIEGITIFS